MSTLRQKEANRRNARKSTGPTAVKGKVASSMNALKTGIHAKSLIIPGENVAERVQLIEEHYQRHQPGSPEARLYVDDLIFCEWTFRRLRAADTQSYLYQNNDIYRDPEKIPPRQVLYLQPALLHPTPAASRFHPPRRRTRSSYPRPPVSISLTPNHFTPNWLRSVKPLHGPTPAGARTTEPLPFPTHPRGA